MNKKRRTRIKAIMNQLGECLNEIEEIKDEEQKSYDNMPDSLKEGEKGERISEVIDILDSVYSSLEDIPGTLEEVMA